MEAVKKVVRVVKAQAKIASKETPKATTVKVVPAPAANAKSDGKRPKVYGKYTAKTAVIFLRDTAKADRQKCLAVMKRLVPAVSPITVNATFYNAKAEKVEIEAEDQKRLKALVG